MSSPFIGLPISAELSNGTVVEGIIHDIDPSTGKLNLAQARFVKYDGSFSEIQPSFILEKDFVKDLMLLSTTRQTSSSSSSSSSPTQNNNSHRHHPHRQNNNNTNSSSSSNGIQSRLNDLSIDQSNQKTHHHQDLFTNTQVTLQPTNHQKNPQPPSRRRRKERDQPKKQQPDEQANHHHFTSHPFNNNPPDSAHEDTDGIPTPELSPPLTTTSQPQTSESPPAIVPSDFNQDFDFQAGLMAFDKAKLWAEIASTDSTDPKDRLIAHNRKKTNGVHFAQSRRGEEDHPRHRNLGPTEMVLSAQEQVTNGSTVSNPWLQSSNNNNPSNPYILSTDGHPIYPVTFDRLNLALSAASVEYGPSLIQRIENAGRSMTDYIIKLLRQSLSSPKSYKDSTISILVGSHGTKASCAIRTGALLALKGFKVFLVLSTNSNRKPAKARNDAFEFQLRLFSSTGATICPQIRDLPSSPTLIIEALAENSVTSLPNHMIIDKTLIDYTHSAPTLGIDISSYLNYDTGEPLVGTADLPSHQHLVCLGALPKGVLNSPSTPTEVCLIDLTLSESCWRNSADKDSDSDEHDQAGSYTHPSNGNHHAQNGVLSDRLPDLPPASWGDGWYTILKIR
ncbi:enhancer of mRNA decapping [Puccinia graminis f. sp. tritici]|uniref:Enhancer of mRNA-decapping protein 3 n=2 Tax=Puccinia graminis f. sp. tritici TaxID=56615 RepID=E3KGY8_PUCGT|nr:uncharacterized protein PGTG_08749 [Puccinia graminis f. sp. tritici CRL 75-36-700-3]EFP83563.1 hypothetical protein PGTG_08749 [Puccinia graminis f. sp. tritici CRL 75-36-700-3]KAA1077978.1 enhancer of mRNA decapping [Puccinia graminis f. sp. tritici]